MFTAAVSALLLWGSGKSGQAVARWKLVVVLSAAFWLLAEHEAGETQINTAVWWPSL